MLLLKNNLLIAIVDRGHAERFFSIAKNRSGFVFQEGPDDWERF